MQAVFGTIIRFLSSRRNRPIFWLILIMCIGIFLRVYRFADFLEIHSDHARDMLIAKHIVEYKEGYMAAPYALGSEGRVKNSPVYYWVLASMWTLSRSTVGMGLVFALVSATIIGLGYAIGLSLAGVRMGLLVSFFLSISDMLVRDAHAVWPPHLLSVVAMGAFCAMARYGKEHRFVWMILFVTALFLGVHIHQSFLPFFGIGIAWSMWQSVRNLKRAVGIAVYIVFHTVLWVVLTENTSDVFLRYLDLISTKADIFSLMSASWYRMFQGVKVLFSHTPDMVSYIYIFAMIISFLFVLKNKRRDERMITVAVFFVGMILYGVYRNNGAIILPEYYLRVPSLLFILTLSYCMAVLIRNTRILVCFMCLTGVLLGVGNLRYFRTSQGNYYDYYQVTKQSAGDYRRITGDTHGKRIMFYTKYFSRQPDSWRFVWAAAPHVYLLEEILGEQVVTIPAQDDNFLAPITQPDSVIYLTCINNLGKMWETDDAFRSKCLNPFLSHYGKYLSLHRQSQLRLFYGANGDTYWTYRFTPAMAKDL